MVFELNTTDGVRRYPADFQKDWTLLFYYSGDFQPVTATELLGLAAMQAELSVNGCGILCISGDTVPVHLAFLETLGRYRLGTSPVAIRFPLGHDPDGTLRRELKLDPAKKYIWLLAPGGEPKALFSYSHSVGANFTEVLRTLLAMQTEKLTPYGWVPGEHTLCLPPATRNESRHFLAAKEKEGAIGIDWYLCFET